MRTFIQDLFRVNAGHLAAWSLGSLLAAVGLECFYRDHTLSTAVGKWLPFLVFGALGLLLMGAVELWESRRQAGAAGGSIVITRVKRSTQIQIAAIVLLVLLFIIW